MLDSPCVSLAYVPYAGYAHSPFPSPPRFVTFSPQPLTHKTVFNELIATIGNWGSWNLVTIVFSSMVSLWLCRLRAKTERWMVKAEAKTALEAKMPPQEAPATPEEPKPARKQRTSPSSPEAIAARLARHKRIQETKPWDIPAQWTLPFTWPNFRAEPGKPRKFGWLRDHAGPRAVPAYQKLTALVQTPDMIRMFQHCPAARREWLPLCRMFGVDTKLVRYAGREPPPRRPRPPRPKLTKTEKWWRALWRDPNPQSRLVRNPFPKNHRDTASIYQLRPRGNIYMEPKDGPDWFYNTPRLSDR